MLITIGTCLIPPQEVDRSRILSNKHIIQDGVFRILLKKVTHKETEVCLIREMFRGLIPPGYDVRLEGLKPPPGYNAQKAVLATLYNPDQHQELPE